MVKCLICARFLDPDLHDVGVHPGCEAQRSVNDDLAMRLREELTGVILWADAHSDRSLQKQIGPSELGTPCDRRIAYRLAGWEEVNARRDPWPAIVGTSVHEWLSRAFAKHRADPERGAGLGWQIEQEVLIDNEVPGHVDLYRDGLVIDWKTAGPDVFKKIVDHGPPAGYRVQINLYALGYLQAGYRVDNVALVFLPRSGWISNMHVWTDEFRPEIAWEALDRMRAIQAGIEKVDIWRNPHIFDRIPARPSHCGYCPFYRRAGLMDGHEADATGCPGVT